MSARSRSTGRRPYGWLGAGALTAGVGAAMVTGALATASVASADTEADSTPGASAGPAQRETSAAVRGTAPRPSRGSANAAKAAASTPTTNRGSDTAATSAPLPRATATIAARVAHPNTGGRGAAAVADTTPELPTPDTADPAAAVAPVRSAPASTTPVTSASAATVPALAVPPTYNTTSYLPPTPIVPGAAVKLAIQQIADTQAALNQATWGAGNPVSGLVSVVPQVLLGASSLSLSLWQNAMPATQGLVTATSGIPIVYQVAQASLLLATTLPAVAGIGLDAASFLIPVVNVLGANTTAAKALLTEAQSNAKVYAVVPVQMKATTEPTINISINNGSRTSMLVDTGSSGLLVTRASVGSGNLGTPIGTGSVSFSGASGQTFSYTTYLTTVDFGGGAVTKPTPVNIVDDADAAAFQDFLAPAGVVGILGTGANTYGPGPLPADAGGLGIPTTSLPGELSDGNLLFQNLFFGLFGVMVFGPNPFPTRVSVPGAPDAFVKVAVGDSPPQDANAIIDSGGVYGTLPANLLGGRPSVPAGTRITVYTADGLTQLYSYVTDATNTPTVVPAGSPPNGLMNTGFNPFQQGPVYINYAAPGGIGSTDFALW